MTRTDTLTYTADVAAPHLAKNVTVRLRVTGMRAWRVRLWIAGKVFALGGWIAGTNIELETSIPSRWDAARDGLNALDRLDRRVPPPRPEGAPLPSRPTR